MRHVIRATLVGLIMLLLVYMLLGAVSSQHVPLKQLVPLPSLERVPDYHRYPPFSNVHC